MPKGLERLEQMRNTMNETQKRFSDFLGEGKEVRKGDEKNHK